MMDGSMARVEHEGVPAAGQAPAAAHEKAHGAGGAHGEYIVRFSTWRRVEHFFTMTTFIVLCATGFPQKYFEWGISHWIVKACGGLEPMRWIHRVTGFTMAAMAALHFALALVAIFRGRQGALSMVPVRRDFQDAIQTLRYYLGLTEQQAKFDRYDYRQKWEYWGLVMGNMIMIVTGFMLFLPTLAARLLPGEAIPAAKLAHSSEGLMAFLVIIVWHIYNAHLNPDVFPMDMAIFSGKISRHRMEHEHPLELARMDEEQRRKTPPAAPPAPPAPAGPGTSGEPGAGG